MGVKRCFTFSLAGGYICLYESQPLLSRPPFHTSLEFLKQLKFATHRGIPRTDRLIVTNSWFKAWIWHSSLPWGVPAFSSAIEYRSGEKEPNHAKKVDRKRKGKYDEGDREFKVSTKDTFILLGILSLEFYFWYVVSLRSTVNNWTTFSALSPSLSLGDLALNSGTKAIFPHMVFPGFV